MAFKRTSSIVIYEELQDLLTYDCPFTGEKRCPPCCNTLRPIAAIKVHILIFCDLVWKLFEMLDIQAKKFEELFWKGVDINNQRFFVCCIGVKSDAPFLAKSGMFLRSFSRRPTRASSRTAAAGVCHLCCAGKEDYEVDVPFEEYGALSPVWLQTCGVLKPYLERSPLL